MIRPYCTHLSLLLARLRVRHSTTEIIPLIGRQCHGPWYMAFCLLSSYPSLTQKLAIQIFASLSSYLLPPCTRVCCCSKSFRPGRSSDDQILRFLSGVDLPSSTATKGITSDLVINNWNSGDSITRLEQ